MGTGAVALGPSSETRPLRVPKALCANPRPSLSPRYRGCPERQVTVFYHLLPISGGFWPALRHFVTAPRCLFRDADMAAEVLPVIHSAEKPTPGPRPGRFLFQDEGARPFIAPAGGGKQGFRVHPPRFDWPQAAAPRSTRPGRSAAA